MHKQQTNTHIFFLFFFFCVGFRSLRDGLETPLERVPCAVAVVLAKASEALASSPGSEIYRVVNRRGLYLACWHAHTAQICNTVVTAYAYVYTTRICAPAPGPLSRSLRAPRVCLLHIFQLFLSFLSQPPPPPPTRSSLACIRVDSFLLHRPYVRLDELPLFDTLFTGVQQGEGGREGGGRGGTGEALGATSASDPGAATAKARVWMLRALRDGERGQHARTHARTQRGKHIFCFLLRAWFSTPFGCIGPEHLDWYLNPRQR